MSLSLAGKIALVTGASRGIGRGIASQLCEAGAYVVGTATTSRGADAITEALCGLRSEGGVGKVLDVSEPESVQALLSELRTEPGSPQILVNNAGIVADNLFLRMKEEEWMRVLNTDLASVYRMSKGCLKGMIRARWGRIINITSVVGATGNPGQANYAAAKAGIVGLSKSLAQEIGSRGITVNNVAPGFITTDMTDALSQEQKTALLQNIPLQRLGAPDDIAAAVLFLASEGAGYITGHTLHVNGGMYMG